MAGAGERIGRSGVPPLFLGPVLLYVLLFALVPVAALFAAGLAGGGGLSGLANVLANPLDRAALSNSLFQGGLSAALAAAIGYPAGVFLGRYSWPGRSLVRALLLVPFLLPTIAVVLGVFDLFGRDGLLSSAWPGFGFLGAGVPAIVLANLVFNVPIVMLFTALGCESASSELEEACTSLGGGPRRAYRDVWGPASLVGAAAGTLLTFLFSALAFAAPLLLCGPRCYTVEVEVWSLDQGFSHDPTGASLLALGMLLILVVPALLYVLLARRLGSPGGGSRLARRTLREGGWVGAALAAESAAILAGIGLLLAAILWRSIVPGPGQAWGAGWSALFSSLTASSLGLPVGAVVANTLFFAALAGSIAIVLALVAGFALRSSPRLASGVSFYLFLPLVISPILLAFSLAQFWRPIFGGPETVWVLIVISQSILALPFALQSLRLPLLGLSGTLGDSARTLGARPWYAYFDADVARVRPALVTAGLFAFAIGLGEFTATYFLATPTFTTLSVAIYRLESGGRDFAAVDGAAALLLLLSLALFLAVVYLGRYRGRAT